MSSVLTAFHSRSHAHFLLLLAVLVGLWGLANGANAQHPTAVTSIVNSTQDTTLEVNHNGSLLAPGTYNPTSRNDSIPATGAGTRMMWYPAKAAFRAGRVGVSSGKGDVWDADSVGAYSVAFGRDTRASRSRSTAMGSETTASGTVATTMGNGTTASGTVATAMGNFTTASGSEATAMGSFTIASGGRSTAMGFGTTAATDESLSIGQSNSANSTSDNTLFVAGNGTSSSPSDALVLDQSGNLTIEGTFTDELGTFAGHFTASKDQGENGNPAAHVALVENTNTGTQADGLAIQIGPTSQPDISNNFITFYDGDGDAIGNIEGDNSGGVNYVSGSADFAEELPVKEGASVPGPADLVGVQGGEISLDTRGAGRVMIASSSPAVTGNATPLTTGDDDRRVPVAFVGQVPVHLRGQAKVGDLIVASGQNDGTGRAVAPAEYQQSKHGPIAGQAWSAKRGDSIATITVAVGLDQSGTVAERLQDQQKQIASLRERVERLETLEKQVAQMDATSGHSVPAGLSGSVPSAVGLLFLVLSGGIGAGLIWRRCA